MQQHGRNSALDVLAYLARAQRPSGFHEHHAARFGEAGLTSIALAVHQFQQLVGEHLIAEQVGEPDDSLLHGVNALHDIGTLFQ